MGIRGTLLKKTLEITSGSVKVVKRTKVKMQITDTPTGPWQKIVIDFVGELPTTNEGNKFIMTIQDNFSKFVILTPLKAQDAESTAEALVDNAILKFGCQNFA